MRVWELKLKGMVAISVVDHRDGQPEGTHRSATMLPIYHPVTSLAWWGWWSLVSFFFLSFIEEFMLSPCYDDIQRPVYNVVATMMLVVLESSNHVHEHKSLSNGPFF